MVHDPACRSSADIAYLHQLLPSTAIGQEAVMANAHKPFGQNMQQETPDQFFSVQCHDFVSVVIPVVLVAKIDFVLADIQDTRVTECGFMAIAGQVIDHSIGSLKPGFGVDDPIALHE